MRPRQNYKIIPGVSIKIDGEHCHEACHHLDLYYQWCNLFRMADGQQGDLKEVSKRFIRCRQCRAYTDRQDAEKGL